MQNNSLKATTSDIKHADLLEMSKVPSSQVPSFNKKSNKFPSNRFDFTNDEPKQPDIKFPVNFSPIVIDEVQNHVSVLESIYKPSIEVICLLKSISSTNKARMNNCPSVNRVELERKVFKNGYSELRSFHNESIYFSVNDDVDKKLEDSYKDPDNKRNTNKNKLGSSSSKACEEESTSCPYSRFIKPNVGNILDIATRRIGKYDEFCEAQSIADQKKIKYSNDEDNRLLRTKEITSNVSKLECSEFSMNKPLWSDNTAMHKRNVERVRLRSSGCEPEINSDNVTHTISKSSNDYNDLQQLPVEWLSLMSQMSEVGSA